MRSETSRKAACAILCALLLLGVIILAFNAGSVKASGTVHIRADGSVDPSYAPIQRNGNLYTLTGNISSDADGMAIERDNIVLDGLGYSVQGAGSGIGIDVFYRKNVTMKNVKVSAFEYGIRLSYSSNSTICKNDLTHNRFSIYLSSSPDNSVYQNTVKNSNYSIYLYGPDSNDNSISENIMTENNNGVWLRNQSSHNIVSKNKIANCLLYGIFVRENSIANTISGNNITGCINGDAIRMYSGGDSNNLYGNYITKNAFGIMIDTSSNDILRNNSMAENGVNFEVLGDGLSHFIQDIDTSNKLNGKPIYYLINKAGLSINPQHYPNVGCLAIINSTNMVVQNLNLTGNHGQGILFVNARNSLIQNATVIDNLYGISAQWSSNNRIIENNLMNDSYAGIYLYYSTNNTLSSNYEEGGSIGFKLQNSDANLITKNVIANASEGIYFSGSSNNNITENTIANNWHGIRFTYSSEYNKIYHNTFLNNVQEVFAIFSTVNVWDNGYPSGGNFWSDYTGTDLFRGVYQNETGSDGIGDTPYVINENNTDHYPLMKPYGGLHDIGLIVSISKPVIFVGYNPMTTITVKIINYGEQAESFNFTFQMGATKKVQKITLASRNSTTFTFAWNATGYAKENYTFEAAADIVSGETTTADNTYFGGIIVTKAGDFGGGVPPQFFKSDFKVDGKDLALFLQCFKGTAPLETMYLADLGGGVLPQFFKCDGIVDGKDLALFLMCYKGLGP